jgi:hypothetical protein
MQEIALNILLGALVIYILLLAFYFFFQERLIFVPLTALERDSKVMLGSEFKEYHLQATDGGIIHAIHITAPHPRGCVLYFHGNTGCMRRWGAIAEELTSYGFDVFLPDYRGYGKSRGKRTESLLFQDALLCYEQVKAGYAEANICVYGRSLGSGMASWLAGQVTPGAVVLETPYNNLIDVARFHSRIIPIKLFLRYTFRNDVYLLKCKAPLLIAHGTKDKIVPYRLGLRLFNGIKDTVRCKMLTIPGGHHGDLNGFPVFRKTLERFFDHHFPKRMD